MLIQMSKPETEKTIFKTISNLSSLRFAKDVVIKPKNKDYENGYLERYFFRQVNNPQARIIEVDKRQWTSFSTNSFYTKVSLIWLISGNKDYVLSSNYKTLSLADKTLPGIKKKFENDLLRFYK